MLSDPRFAKCDTYIMAAYVKFFESAGARVVPLIKGETQQQTFDKLSKLNGVVFPGGAGNYRDYG